MFDLIDQLGLGAASQSLANGIRGIAEKTNINHRTARLATLAPVLTRSSALLFSFLPANAYA
jgi:hypothetical protein